MREDTTIMLKRSTKRRLDDHLVKKGETYDDIINRLLDAAEATE